jgi:glycolate oxidase
VIGLEVVLADGECLRLGGRSPQPGPDAPLVNLFVGSEGTLGIVTEITVRLIEKPASRATVVASFPRLGDASQAVTAILGAGVVPLALEVMDRTTLRCVESHLRAGLPTDMEAMLLIDLDGAPEAVEREAALVGRLLEEHGAASVELATTPGESDRLWAARRSTSSSFGRLRPNKLGEDVSVPRSRIPEVVREVEAIARRHDLLIPLFGHIGDGNLHPNILCDLRDEGEMARVVRAAAEIFAVALRVGGTLSGEHGIGLLKREFLPTAIGPVALELSRAVKAAIDPQVRLNPGKVV